MFFSVSPNHHDMYPSQTPFWLSKLARTPQIHNFKFESQNQERTKSDEISREMIFDPMIMIWIPSTQDPNQKKFAFVKPGSILVWLVRSSSGEQIVCAEVYDLRISKNQEQFCFLVCDFFFQVRYQSGWFALAPFSTQVVLVPQKHKNLRSEVFAAQK